jgi:predicted esterase
MTQIEGAAETGGPEPFETSTGYERFRRAWIQLKGAASLAGEAVEVQDGERLLGSARLAEDSGASVALIELPMPPPGSPYGELSLRLKGSPAGRVRLPDADEERMKAFRKAEVHFAPYVFTGKGFPDCEFDQPSLVEDLIGRYAIRVDFYDAEYRPATVAERPGRYGAVIEIEAEDGRIFQQFRTLFRKPDPDHGWFRQPSRPSHDMSEPMPMWYGLEEPVSVQLPSDLGIDPEVTREQATTLAEYLRSRFDFGCWDDPWTPKLLAGLYETFPGEGDLRRNNAWERDRRWWFELKRRLGFARLPRLLYLPRDYDEDREKLWPLVLFLHGSGEIGEDLDRVRESGMAKLAEEGRSFPFLLVAPQSPPDEWFWNSARLNALLDEVTSDYRVDPDRVYATGLSMGGRGTWVQAIEFPDRFAAIAPICGSIPELEEAKRIRHLPVWAFVGAKDGDPSIRRMVDALRSAGGDVRLTVYPDAGHDAWTPTYADPAFYEWLLSRKREPHPE